MKKIINGRRYDTSTARLIGEYSKAISSSDFSHFEESLYCKKTGEYFLAGEGGPMTKYARSSGQNEWSGGSEILPITADDAREWAEKHLTAEEYEAEFGATAE